MIIITGMHRSGTSLSANLLYELDVTFGDLTLLMPADQWNPRGYYENTEIHILNDQLLLGDLAPIRRFRITPPAQRSIPLRLAMTLFRARYALAGAGRLIERRAARHADDIRRLAEVYQHVAIKDPRFSLTVGAWARLVSIDRVLYCYRHPYEVARSLWARYRLPLWIGYALWRGHVTRFFAQAEGLPLVMVNYDGYFGANALDEVRRLYAFARRPFDEAEAQAVMKRVLDPKLKRNLYDGAALPRDIAATYEMLNALHEIYAEVKPFGEPAIEVRQATVTVKP